jgi:uncharacterized membrane protein YbhN (UPF0104 family)
MFSSQEIKPQPTRSLLRIFGTLIALGLVIFLVWRNWYAFVAALGSLPISLLLLVLANALMSRMMVTLRWFILLRLVAPKVTFLEVFKLSFVGLFTTNVLPSTIGGDVVKLGGALQFGLNSADVTASLIMDRLCGMGTMASFLPFGIIAMFQTQSISAVRVTSSSSIFVKNLWNKLLDFLRRVKQALRLWLEHPRVLLMAALFSYVHMACTFAMVSLILNSLGHPTPFWKVGGLWVLIYFITLIPISINGLGLQEFSLSLIYTNIAGVSEANSLVLALLMRIMFMIASLPGALFLPEVFSGGRKVKQYNQQSGSRDE